MHLPPLLQKGIEEQLSSLKLSELQKFSEGISLRYRECATHFLRSRGDRLAYLAARFPATYAACREALLAAKARAPDLSIESLLDLGAGPGTGMWASQEIFPAIKKATLVEKDPEWVEIGKALASQATCQTSWQVADLEKEIAIAPHDLILSSYAIGELSEKTRSRLVGCLWQSVQKLLVFIEPGTPKGFERIRAIRTQLIDLGASLIAPCPHAEACPMKGGDWCHFAKRLERSPFHRKVKGGALGYEDEKFSYVVVGKEPSLLPIEGRILRHPLKRSGHVALTVCTPQGVSARTISRKQKDKYHQARKAEWGDSL